ncbi:MAG: hypothetical protein K8F91_02875 [Candidatus Obscuribacterales bacterium]|nr:hypothetical protein [Candidatus Obscuribacterales bacterium]
MTQWVFGKGRCECARPEPVEKRIDGFISLPISSSADGLQDVELELQGDEFPIERYAPLSVLGRGAAGVG